MNELTKMQAQKAMTSPTVLPNKSILQRLAVNPSPAHHVPPIVHDVLRSPGHPLDFATRAFMEPRFGHDFSQVRVHTDEKAAESARAVNALAYTVGNNVVFGPGQNPSPQYLLAHELAHVIQQGGQPTSGSLIVTSANDPAESVADAAARNVLSRSQPPPLNGVDHRLQRLGANPGCTPGQAADIHQAIFNARGWINKTVTKLDANPLTTQTLASLRRNFGPTYGVAANASLIADRLRIAYREMSTIPFSCAGAADTTCAAGHCGYATTAGSHAAVICTNTTPNAVFRAGCILHESLHAAFSRFTVDEYSGWHGHSGSTATYPGAGSDPLLNADSYTTLTMDLS